MPGSRSFEVLSVQALERKSADSNALSRLMAPQTVGLRGRGAHIAGRLPLLSSVVFSIFFAPSRSTRPCSRTLARPALFLDGPFPDAPSPTAPRVRRAPRTRRKPKPPAPCSPGSDPRFGICSRPRGADCQSFAAPSSPVAGPAGRAPRRRRRSDRATRSHRWTEIVGSSSSPTYDEVHFRPVAATISKGSRALDGQHVWRPLSAGGHAARCARRFAPRLRQRADRQRPGTHTRHTADLVQKSCNRPSQC